MLRAVRDLPDAPRPAFTRSAVTAMTDTARAKAFAAYALTGIDPEALFRARVNLSDALHDIREVDAAEVGRYDRTLLAMIRAHIEQAESLLARLDEKLRKRVEVVR